MPKQIKAVYEHGVFRPLGPVALQEHQEVTLSITDGTVQPANEEPVQSCFELAQRLGLIGVVTGMPADLSTNKVHFDGFGHD